MTSLRFKPLQTKPLIFVLKRGYYWIAALTRCLEICLRSFPRTLSFSTVYVWTRARMWRGGFAYACGNQMTTVKCQAWQCSPPSLKQGLSWPRSLQVKIHWLASDSHGPRAPAYPAVALQDASAHGTFFFLNLGSRSGILFMLKRLGKHSSISVHGPHTCKASVIPNGPKPLLFTLKPFFCPSQSYVGLYVSYLSRGEYSHYGVSLINENCMS